MPRRKGARRLAHARPRGRTLAIEQLESRSMLSLTHLYTFNDGLPNDWVGNAHATTFNGATIVNGQLTLANLGVTSGSSGVVQYARLPAGILPATGSLTVEAWFTSSDPAEWARVFDFGDQSGVSGNTYLFFTPASSESDSRSVLRPGGDVERIAAGSVMNDGQQHAVAAVVDVGADLLRLYLDGVEVSTAPLGGATAASINDSLNYLGRSLFNVDPGFTGSINEVRIYDEARTPEALAEDAAVGPTALAKSPLVRQMEYLNRGVVAVRRSTTQAYIGWRLLGTDPASIAFNLYRSNSGGIPVKLNGAPLIATTDFTDTPPNFTSANVYFVRPVLDGVELAASESYTLAAAAPVQQHIDVPLTPPPGGSLPATPGTAAHTYTETANDASVGDLDGDGQYEIILKWDPTDSKDNSQEGYTGLVYVDAYKLDGTRLWRINLGRNMRAGAHYNQFLVYDFDGDGKAEVVMRTAEGTTDGVGTVIGNVNADYRNSSGYVLSGPEYLTVFNGETGAIINSIPFSPVRGSVSSWGDNYGNRVDRFQATVAYLDGVHPSMVWGRGYAGPQSGLSARNEVAAFDYSGGQLSLRWLFAAATNGANPGYVGQSAHSITVGDVDGDGKDEVVTGAATLNDNGGLLYLTGLGHGDALHMTDMDPARPGLEIFMPHEGTGSNGHIGASLRDARTGAIIAGPTVVEDPVDGWPDVGRGNAFDVDPNSPGYEFWDSYHGSIYSAQGVALYTKGNIHVNFGAWWDADLLRETVDGTTIADWNYTTHGRVNLVSSGSSGINSTSGLSSNNGTKSTPALVADLLGDWREEVIWRRSDNTQLQIWTTSIPSTTRLYALMNDPQYRQAISWQNSGYNQPPHQSFFLGAGMAAPPTPQIYIASAAPLAGDFNGDRRVDALDLATWQTAYGQIGLVGPAPGDADGDLHTTGSDFLAWQQNFGAPEPSSLAAASAAASSAIAAESLAAPGPAPRDVALERLAAESLRTLLTPGLVPRHEPSIESERAVDVSLAPNQTVDAALPAGAPHSRPRRPRPTATDEPAPDHDAGLNDSPWVDL